jgi:lipopolysaccharide export system protein LptC
MGRDAFSRRKDYMEAVRTTRLSGAPVYSAQNPVNGLTLDARFARAARHSRLVRFLRISIPGVVAFALASVIALSLFNPFRVVADVPTNMDNIVVSGTKITMESPHMSGFSADERPYELWAKTAVQDVADPDNVDLDLPRGKMLMQDQSTMKVDAQTGRFNNKAQILNLYKDVFLQTTNGYEARLNHAQVDIGAGAVSTDDGVNVKFDGGRVKADRLRMSNRGEIVRFEGNVVVDLDHGPPQPAAPAVAEEPRVPAPAKARAPSTNRASAK